MFTWLSQHWNDLNIALSVWTFVLSIGVLAFSALRFMQMRRAEQKKERFQTYHDLLKSIGRGIDKDGPMKLVSQRAYIYELRHFKEYAPLTIRLLESLQEEWSRGDPDKLTKLAPEIAETKECLTRHYSQRPSLSRLLLTREPRQPT